MIIHNSGEQFSTKESVDHTILGCLIRFPNLLINSNLINYLKPKYFSTFLYRTIFNTLLIYKKDEPKYICMAILSEEVYKELLKNNKTNYNSLAQPEIHNIMADMYSKGQLIKFNDLATKFILSSLEKEIKNILVDPTITNKLDKIKELTEEVDSFKAAVNKDKKGIAKGESFGSIANKKDKNDLDLLGKLDKAILNPGLQESSGVIKTGFKNIDKYISGLTKSNLGILAGRPAMGKTALGFTIANKIAYKKKESVLFVSLEMTKEELIYRRLSMLSKATVRDIKEGRITEKQLSNIKRYIKLFEEEKTFNVLDTNCTDINYIIESIRISVEEQNTSVVIIDYIQMMSDLTTSKNLQKTYELESICVKLKNLAKELDIAILCLAQISRKSSSKINNIPTMSDLKDSGAIEQYADFVLLIHREDYYDQSSILSSISSDNSKKESYDDYNDSEIIKAGSKVLLSKIIIAKNRNGATGCENLEFIPELVTFKDASDAYRLDN